MLEMHEMHSPPIRGHQTDLFFLPWSVILHCYVYGEYAQLLTIGVIDFSCRYVHVKGFGRVSLGLSITEMCFKGPPLAA